MSFAVLRNTHEAFRTSIRLQHEALKRGDVPALRAEWETFQRVLALHVAMEDDALFALLDEVSSGAISAHHLEDEHLEEHRFAQRVTEALATGSAAQLYGTWLAWRDVHLLHLAHEEEIVTPLTMRTGATPEARGRVFHARVLSAAADHPEFGWSLGWIVRRLAEHGSTGQPAHVATRVFAWGLQTAASAAQWQRWRPIVRANCPPEMWADMAREFGLDGEGAVG